MNLRRTTTTRRALAAVAITTGLVFSLAGCGGDGDKEDGASKSSAPATQRESGDKPEASQSSTGEPLVEVKSNGITLKVTSAKRDQGGFVTLNGSVTNGTSHVWVGSTWKSDERELASNGGSLAGASLVDQAGKKKYLVLRDTQGRCLCTKFEGGISQGQSTDWFAQFPAPPEGTTSVQLQVPTMPPAQLDITEGE
ncbi:hypothetical protein GTY65_12265 [Streptomyces sp. SID8379]|uniref:hypothetical protein n=1 Tax=unclassified Streptomyces TaxID=2593676 RepID=UPI00037FF488|nr:MULTISPECIES: hypothetical protein [unclassified Streptomyces]MYW64834.1 hypothetical protein [Streptomyces sp. SID8379]